MVSLMLCLLSLLGLWTGCGIVEFVFPTLRLARDIGAGLCFLLARCTTLGLYLSVRNDISGSVTNEQVMIGGRKLYRPGNTMPQGDSLSIRLTRGLTRSSIFLSIEESSLPTDLRVVRKQRP